MASWAKETPNQKPLPFHYGQVSGQFATGLGTCWVSDMNGKRGSETSSADLISGVVYSQNMHLILSDLIFLSIGKRTVFVDMLVGAVKFSF